MLSKYNVYSDDFIKKKYKFPRFRQSLFCDSCSNIYPFPHLLLPLTPTLTKTICLQFSRGPPKRQRWRMLSLQDQDFETEKLSWKIARPRRVTFSLFQYHRSNAFQNGPGASLSLLQISASLLRFFPTNCARFNEGLSLPRDWGNEGLCVLAGAAELSSSVSVSDHVKTSQVDVQRESKMCRDNRKFKPATELKSSKEQ